MNEINRSLVPFAVGVLWEDNPRSGWGDNMRHPSNWLRQRILQDFELSGFNSCIEYEWKKRLETAYKYYLTNGDVYYGRDSEDQWITCRLEPVRKKGGGTIFRFLSKGTEINKDLVFKRDVIPNSVGF